MRRAIAASRADLKYFSRAARSRSPRVLNMVPAMALRLDPVDVQSRTHPGYLARYTRPRQWIAIAAAQSS
jgi:hypothetical protein